MTTSIKYNIWSNDDIRSRGTNYSEGVIVINKRRASRKYRRALYRNNVIKDIKENKFILLRKNSQGVYPIIGSGYNYEENFDSCHDFNGICINGEGTHKKCNKGKCLFGFIEQKSKDIFKVTTLDGEKYVLSDKLYEYNILEGFILKETDFNSIKNIIIFKAFKDKCGLSEACINSHLSKPEKEDIILAIISYLNSYPQGWKEYILSLIDPLFNQNFNTVYEFLLECIRIIYTLKDCILLYKENKYNNFRYDYNTTHPRPVYYRLPAAYRNDVEDVIFLRDIEQRLFISRDKVEIGTLVLSSDLKKAFRFEPRKILDPLIRLEYDLDPFNLEIKYSPRDFSSWREVPEEDIPRLNVAKWLTSGFDLFLSKSYLKMERFFHDFVDPSTCFAMALDWNHQFYGWTPSMWDETWDTDTKRALLLNSFGWDKNELSFIKDGREIQTFKGYVMKMFPYNVFENFWIDSLEDSFVQHFWGDIELSRFEVDEGLVNKNTDVQYNVSKERWEGLFPSKGTLMSLLFLFSAFKIYATDVVNEIENNQVVLTNNTLTNLPIKPVIINPSQVGIMEDLYSLNNPLIAGVTRLGYSNQRIIFPVSYRYGRLGKYWTQISNIIKEWTPITSEVKIQYPYLAADYSVADDYFFAHEQ